MTENQQYTLAQLIRFDTVDGNYLQENEVDHLHYFLIDDEFMQLATAIQNDIVDETKTTTFDSHVASLVELQLNGNTAIKNYSKYDYFIECTDFIEAFEQSITTIMDNGHKRNLIN